MAGDCYASRTRFEAVQCGSQRVVDGYIHVEQLVDNSDSFEFE